MTNDDAKKKIIVLASEMAHRATLDDLTCTPQELLEFSLKKIRDLRKQIVEENLRELRNGN